MEAGDAEKDALWLGVVAGAIAIGYHRTIAAKHLHGGGHLEERTGQKLLVLKVCYKAWRSNNPGASMGYLLLFDYFPPGCLTELTTSTDCFIMDGHSQSRQNKPI